MIIGLTAYVAPSIVITKFSTISQFAGTTALAKNGAIMGYFGQSALIYAATLGALAARCWSHKYY